MLWDYDANGTKLRQESSSANINVGETALDYANATSTTPSVRDYVNGIEYVDNQLEAIYHEEGRIIKKDSTFEWQWRLSDHLNNTSVLFSDVNGDGEIDAGAEVLSRQNYYPGGLAWSSSINTSPLQRHLYSNNEFIEDFGLRIFDFVNRGYDPALWRFYQIDKLAEDPMQIDKSPYAAMWNNPVRLSDPLGLAPTSPIYGEDGTFLGTDSEGFSGDIIVMNQYIYEKLSKGGNKILDHKFVTSLTENTSVSNVLNEANLSPEALSKILTNVISNMKEVNLSKLYNGSISVRDIVTGEEFNDPTNTLSLANVDGEELVKSGKIKLTAYLYSGAASSELSTVEQAQNTLGIHEYQGHGIKKFGDRAGNHYKAYELQMAHPSFKKSSPGYQSYIEDNYKAYLYKENLSKYKRKYEGN